MDMLTEVLEDVRSSGSLLGRNLLSPPWSIGLEEDAALTLVAVLRGEAWLLLEGHEPTHLAAGDRALVTGPRTFAAASDPTGRGPHCYVQSPTGICRDSAGRPLVDTDVRLGTRTHGTCLDGENVLLTGSFPATGRKVDRLLGSLPPVLRVPATDPPPTALALLEEEIGRDDPGQQTVLDRLLEVALVGTIRDWFALPEAAAPAWYAAASDPVVGPALTAMQDDPARRWDVGSLAENSGISRAAFARRFRDVMGQPPIGYLTGWRLCLASDLLAQTDRTLDSIARQVGYSSGFALSAAFTREYGVRPATHRETSRA
jgi:AraC-like DNA-binding protein